MLALGVDPVLAVAILGALLAGIGIEVFGLGWSLAMQEHVPDEMLSRAYSYDALGSFVAIPVGQLAFGPIGVGVRDPAEHAGRRIPLPRGLPGRLSRRARCATCPARQRRSPPPRPTVR